MAGKLFPETYIGDSEDLFKKIPTGKKHCAPQKDLKSASPLSMDNESRDSDNLADSAELKEQLVLEDEGHQDEAVEGSKEEDPKQAHCGYQKEEDEVNQHHQKSQHRNLLDFGWLQEKEEEEEAHQDDLVSMTEDANGQEVVTKNSVCDPQEGIWPPPGDNTEEHLEPRVNEVALIDSFESDSKYTLSASTSVIEDLNSSPVDPEGYQLCDEEDYLKDSSASTGYFPCYRTYVEFPKYQPPSEEDSPPVKSEKQLGSCRDAGVQCDGCAEEVMISSEKRGAEANNNSKEAKPLMPPLEVPRAASGGGPKPVSSGRKLEGLGGKHTKHLGDGGQEAGSNKKDYEGGATKPSNPGSSPTRTRTKIGVAKDPQGSGPQTSKLPVASGARKSVQKRKHRTGRPDEKEQVLLAELKPLLHDQRSLPPGPEETTGILNVCYGMEDAGENSEVRLVKAKAKNMPRRNLSAHSCPSTTETAATPEPRPITSRLSLHSIVSWVRKIFRKPPSGQPQPSTSQGTETSRRAVASRLRQWLTQHSNRVHPHPP